MLSVRERPPTLLSVGVKTPSGRHARWAHDEAKPENVFSGLTKSSVMPGGHENFGCTLPRQPGRDYPDLEPMSTIAVYGAGGDKRGEYRLEHSPRKSGDQMSVAPVGVGWQAALDDAKLTGYIYVDQDPSGWAEVPLDQKIAVAGDLTNDYSASTSDGGVLGFIGGTGNSIASGAQTRAWYAAPAGVQMARLMYRAVEANAASEEPPKLFPFSDLVTADASIAMTADDSVRTADLITARRYLMLRAMAASTHTPAAGTAFSRIFKFLALYGDHGLPTYDTVTDGSAGKGVLCSDVEAHAVGRWATILNFTTGSLGTIQPSGFVLPQLAFHDPTTVSGIVKQATRFELRDWAVWDDKTYYSNDRGARGRKWRARVAPSQLDETGPQVARIWNEILVSYRDVDGSTKIVGPPGSGADVEDPLLQDLDPENPANKLGVPRCDLLEMDMSSPAAAIRTGALFLQEAKLLDASGQARLTGWVQDDKGIVHAASVVRGGDQIAFTDAHDTGYRRIVREEYTHDTYTCTVDLDAPPDGLQQLLERLNVVLVPLGLSS